MSEKRLRIFAGPNGSGKSTFIKAFPSGVNLKLGVCVNADDLEKELKNSGSLNFYDFNILSSTLEIQDYFIKSNFSPTKINDGELWKDFSVAENKLSISPTRPVNSYIAADLAEYIRQKLLHSGESFSFETVMSDSKKIEFLKKAKTEGYRIYLYYFSTEDPIINKNRVKDRVAQDGHPVDDDIIEKRYFKSLNNLKGAVLQSDRAYIFDSTGFTKLIAEITDGINVKVIDVESVPNWVVKYILKIENNN
jgi:predicted ABC-type ATPase